MTPGFPLASMKAQSAAALETCCGSVVTLAATPTSATGPTDEAACQETIGILAALACCMAGPCSIASNPMIAMPSGLSASAWPNAAVRPLIEPAPSSTFTVQPRAVAASCIPLAVPTWPPFFRSPARMTMVLPVAPFGPVVGPSHAVTLLAYLSTIACASDMPSARAGAAAMRAAAATDE